MKIKITCLLIIFALSLVFIVFPTKGVFAAGDEISPVLEQSRSQYLDLYNLLYNDDDSNILPENQKDDILRVLSLKYAGAFIDQDYFLNVLLTDLDDERVQEYIRQTIGNVKILQGRFSNLYFEDHMRLINEKYKSLIESQEEESFIKHLDSYCVQFRKQAIVVSVYNLTDSFVDDFKRIIFFYNDF